LLAAPQADLCDDSRVFCVKREFAGRGEYFFPPM